MSAWFSCPTPRRAASSLVVLIAGLGLAGCTTFGPGSDSAPAAPASSGGSSSFMNVFRYGGTTVPPSRAPEEEEIDCPAIELLDGTAALRQIQGETVRSQVSIVNTARECRVVPGSNQVSIKMGVEVRALLGPAGSPGTFAAPVRFVVKRSGKVVASRFQRTSVTIAAGETQNGAVIVEDQILIPNGDGELELLAGLDPSGRAEGSPKKKRRN